MSLEDGCEVNYDDYDDDDSQEAKEPKEPTFNVGYGKATVKASELLITSNSAVVPNGLSFTTADGKTARAGYFSYSALTTYRRCQRAYFHRYVEKQRTFEPSVKMWGGSAMHNTIEQMLRYKIDNPDIAEAIKVHVYGSLLHKAVVDSSSGITLNTVAAAVASTTGKELQFTPQNLQKTVISEYLGYEQAYEEERANAAARGDKLPPISYGSRISSPEQFHTLYKEAIVGYGNSEFIYSNPVSVEDLLVYQLPLHTGGTVPIVGFTDVIEKTEFMREHYENISNPSFKDLEPHEIKEATEVLKTIDNGELMVTDHKCGMGKSYEEARTDQQLTLYSLATGHRVVGFDSIKLGTTGGSRADRAKPATVAKFFATRDEKDHIELINDFNSIIAGISAGIFDKSGMSNLMVCSPTLCPYYLTKCFKKR